MGIYTFKEWLSFEEAAAWLTDSTGDSYDANSILRLALKGRVPVHYWPTDDAEIVIFRINMQANLPLLEGAAKLDLDVCEPVCTVFGPVPISNFRMLYPSIQKSHAGVVGLSFPHESPENYGCYRLGEDDRPQSIAHGEYELLIHLDDLETMREGLPLPKHCQPHTLLIPTLRSASLPDPIYIARSTADWHDLPDSDLPLPKPAHESVASSEPLLRALGVAAHLIAALGKQLDSHEQIESKKKRYAKGSLPNVSKISQAMAEAAAELRLEGHNFKGAGFSKLLTKALRELG